METIQSLTARGLEPEWIWGERWSGVPVNGSAFRVRATRKVSTATSA